MTDPTPLGAGLPDTAMRLAEALREAGFTNAGIAEHLGPAATQAMYRGEPGVVRRACSDGSDLSLLVRFFILREPVAQLPLAAALGGDMVRSLIDDSVATPIILILLVGVGVFVALNPKFGQEGAGIFSGKRLALAALVVAVIGGYDGVFGPGTGMFLIMAFTAVFTQGFVRSAAMSKVVNTATNLGALLVFGLGGFINWKLALALAVANVVGAQLGARTVLKGGSTLVRVALLGLVVTLCAKLGWDLLQHQ
mgnify:CR=1 FL=1